MSTNTQARPAFGTVLADQMAIATYRNGQWGQHEIRPTGPIEIHPAAHVLHYASECFEGFKAYRWADGSIHVFRMDKHIERMRQSARLLVLPEPDAKQLATMVLTVIDRVRDQVPEPPGALYMRPMLYGTMPNIGAASAPSNEATLIVPASPVWDYFTAGPKPLRIYVEDQKHRTADHLGMVKTGGNYAAAIKQAEKVAKTAKGDQLVQAHLAAAYVQSSLWQKALPIANKLLEDSPANSPERARAYNLLLAINAALWKRDDSGSSFTR